VPAGIGRRHGGPRARPRDDEARDGHPYKGPGPKEVAPGDFSQTHVGDEYDTSPFRDEKLMGISTAAFIRNMSVLIRAVAQAP
jgi:hypothetical protein